MFQLFLLLFAFTSCSVINNKNFTDRRFKRMLKKNTWINPGQGFGTLINSEKFKEQGGYGGYQYSKIKLNRNGTFNNQKIFGGKGGEFDSLYIYKYEDTYWNVKDNQFYTKAKVTYRQPNLKDSTLLEAVYYEEKVYRIDIRNSESTKAFEVDFYEIEKMEKWNRIQDFKTIRTLKKNYR